MARKKSRKSPRTRKPLRKRAQRRTPTPRQKALHRYTAAINVIKTRTGATRKEAQEIYRAAKNKTPTALKKLKRSTLKAKLRKLRQTNTRTVYDAKRDSENGDGDAAFSLKSLHGDKIADRVADLDEVTVTATVQTYKQGVLSRERTLRRTGVPVAELMYAYHEMVRDDFESEDGYGEGVITTGLAVTP